MHMLLSLPSTVYLGLERLNITCVEEILLDTVKESLKH